MEKKAVSVHGSLERIAKLEAERLKVENDLKHLKFLYSKAGEASAAKPDKSVVLDVSCSNMATSSGSHTVMTNCIAVYYSDFN